MRLVRVATLVAAAVLAACVTINVYFPEAAVKDLSEQIEDEVRRQAADDAGAETPEPPAAQSEGRAAAGSVPVAYLLASVLTGASPAYAQDEVPTPEITNPAIRKIIDSRAQRLPELNRYKDQGVLGESNQALVEIRDLDALSDLRERAAVQRLVKAENADREQLFREIAAAKDVELSQLPRIRETYAQTLREKAKKGHWIQLPDGTWKQK